MRDRGQYHPPMHRDDLRILPFPITHARTYNTRLVSSRQPSLNVHRGPSRRDRAVGGVFLPIPVFVIFRPWFDSLNLESLQ